MLNPVTDADLPAIVALANAAYRGEKSWTNEAAYIEGARTTVDLIRADLAAQPQAELLGWRDEPGGELIGCVWLEPAKDGAWYLGMLTVSPDQQARRLGRQILAAAEAVAAKAGAPRIRMTVVNIRDTLIAWYERRGYALTGETLPFPYDDNRFGRPTRNDLHFVVLEKGL